MIDAPPFAGPTKAGDHLVGDQQCAVIPRDRLDRGQPIVGRNHVTGSTLHRFGDHCGDRAGGGILDLLAREFDAIEPAVRVGHLERTAVTVGVGHLVTTARQRSITLLGFIADKPEHAHGLAVEAAPEADHLIFLGHGPREPKRRFDRLGAAAIQMRALQVGGRHLADQLEGLDALARRERPDHQARRLFGNRLGQRRMSVTEAGDRDAGEEIDVGVAVGIGQGRAVTVLEGNPREQRDPLAAGRDIALLFGEDLARLGARHRGYDFRQFGLGGRTVVNAF